MILMNSRKWFHILRVLTNYCFASSQLLYCLQVYRGDEKIKNFIWDLISPNESGEANIISRNHSGLHNLVPRGRNAKGRMRILEYNNKFKPIKTNTYAIFFIFSLVNSNPIHVSIHFIYFAFCTLCAA